jgi:hypothetical protein
MKSMTDKLSGNYDEDMTFLISESVKYKDQENYLDIMSALGELTYDLLPDDEKENMENVYIQNILEKITFHMNQGNHDEAIIRTVLLIRKMEEMKWHKKRSEDYNLVISVLNSYSAKVSRLKQYENRLNI